MVSYHDIDVTIVLAYSVVMARTALTLRIDASERNALKSLSKIEGRPVNQLLIEAIKAYLGRKGQRERTLAADMRRLEAYRRKDPKFGRAVAAFVEAEATLKDPLEGVPFEEPEESHGMTGPLQSKVREALDA